MKDIDVMPLVVDLIELFYRSSRDALRRAKEAASSHPFLESTGLTIFSQRDAETQATVESALASFFTIETAINYVFFTEIEREYNKKALDKWLKGKWKSLSVSDRLVLVLSKYGYTDLNKFQNVTGLFQEFTTFRNKIVHAYPSKYDVLVEPASEPNKVLIHAVDPIEAPFSLSGLSGEVARISYQDAARSYEIMLLVLALLDAQFILDLELAWYDKPADMLGLNIATPIELLNALEHKYYPKIDPKEFIPKSIADLLQKDE